ncbi:MAG: peptidyl-Lys metalloendopeptidase, partial [Colwellia sp.]
FIKLKSAESLSQTFELTSLYNMSEAGNYEVAYDVTSFHLFSNKGQQKKAEKLQSNTAYIYLEGFESKGTTVNKGKPGGVTPSTLPTGNTITLSL